MQQEIDFYPQLGMKNSLSAWLSPESLLAGYAMFVVLLVLVLVFNGARLRQAGVSLAQLNTQLQSVSQQTNTLATALLPAAQKTTFQHMLPGADTRAFPDILEAFARSAVPGVWLTTIHISNPEHKMELEGMTTNPRLIQGFLEQLSRQGVFRGMIFQLGEIQKNANGMVFHLAAQESAK